MVTVTVLSLTPQPPQMHVTWGDKLQHMIAYAALMAWFIQVYSRDRRPRLAGWLLTLGIAIEFLQWLTPYRSFDVLDMVADALGIGLGWALGTALARAAILSRVEAMVK